MKHEELLRQMTLAEKCALLSGRDVWHTRAIERLGIPSITLADGPSGLRKQAAAGDHLGLNASTPATCMPSASAVANTWNVHAAERVGRVIGCEARAQDVQVLLAPGLNTKRSPLCGRNFEYYSEDPYLSGKLAAAFIRGVQENGVSACAKHFCANSQELLRMHGDSVLDERTLREMYLTNFEIAVTEGKPRTIMTAYNRVNGVYANEHEHLLSDILRGEWGFDGAVVTDWGGGNDFVEGVRAGCNLEMPGCGDDSPVRLMQAVREGKISEKTVDERVDALLELILTTYEKRQPGTADTRAHHAIAAEVAEEAVVLLKNQGDVLPLLRSARIAVIGDFVQSPRFQGAGSSMVNAAKEDCAQALLPDYFPNVLGISQGFRREDVQDERLAAQAETLAREAEYVLLYLGLTEGYETEGLDREHMRLPRNQIDLLTRLHRVNRRIIAVVTAGSPIEMPWIDQCEALVWTGLGGQAAAGAVLRVLCGQVNPSGHLAESFPLRCADAPVHACYPGRERTSEYREGLYVGYRCYDTANIPVRFPFGYGLSYTAFRYDELTVSERAVSFRLTNTGHCAGAEVAQVYVSLPGAKIFRPRRELKGFAKVHLDAGESRVVTIPLDDKAFRYWNVRTNAWEVEGGEYAIQVGASVADIRLTGHVRVEGTNAPDPYAGKGLTCYERCDLTHVPDEQFAALLGRPIPPPMWDRSAPLGMNDTLLQMSYARNPLARGVHHLLTRRKDRSIAAGKPDLNLLFICHLPFRGIAKMMNGMVSMDMAEALLTLVNHRGLRGLGRLIGGFFRRPRIRNEE